MVCYQMKNSSQQARRRNNIALAIVILVGLLTILPYVKADYTFQEHKLIDLKVPCILNDYPCPSTVNCNLSINYPNSNYLINSKRMTALPSGDYNYSLYFDDAGIYKAKVACTDGIENGTSTFDITINSDGQIANNITLIIFLFVIAYVLLLIGIFTRNVSVTMLGGFATIALGIFSIVSGINGVRNELTYIISIMTIAFGGFWTIKAGIEQIEENLE